MKCIDLERRFPQYRLAYEDPAFVGTQDPWHKVIVCRSGVISPAGGTKLWACTSSRKVKAARKILAGELPVRIVMDGDDGVNAEFDVKDYKQVFKALGAKLR